MTAPIVNTAPASQPRYGSAREAAVALEGVFISQLLDTMSQGLKTDGPFGGGSGERNWRGLLNEQYGQVISKRGGFGIAGAVEKMMLQLQEAERPA